MAKNEVQRLRNIARAKKVTVPGVGLAPIIDKSAFSVSAPTVTASSELIKAADLAKKSTASLGKFQDKLPAAMEKKVGVYFEFIMFSLDNLVPGSTCHVHSLLERMSDELSYGRC